MGTTQHGNGGSRDEAYSLAKLATTYLAILDEEWDDLPDDERRDLAKKARDAVLRLGAALERDRPPSNGS